jgi:hypothetical protein
MRPPAPISSLHDVGYSCVEVLLAAKHVFGVRLQRPQACRLSRVSVDYTVFLGGDSRQAQVLVAAAVVFAASVQLKAADGACEALCVRQR